MTSPVRQAVAFFQISWRSLTRSWGLWGMTGLLALATGVGFWWRDFNFGSAEGPFLWSFGWGVQQLGGMVLMVAAGLQIWGRDQEDGSWGIWRAQGVSPVALCTGRLLAGGLFAIVFAVVSSVVLGAVLVMAGHGPSPLHLGVVALGLGAKLCLVAAVVFWLGSWSRSVGFVIAGVFGILLIGHLRPWATDVGGVPMVLSWVAPDFAGLTWSPRGLVGEKSLGPRLLAATGYLLVLIWLAARGMGRRE